ncbi:MAG: hypothetical protein JXA13_05780 [Anaerolineales bacterium]|nr:hypothetical protein [Anaerolineales bacterium]
MISINYLFWTFVILFAIIGGMRGWAKELLVSFSVILTLAFLHLMERYIPFIQIMVPGTDPSTIKTLFWIRISILVTLVFFGYQTVAISRLSSKAVREKLQDTLLGIFFGALNGYLVVGSIWYYLDAANYSFAYFIHPATLPVDIGGPITAAIDKIMPYLPPHLLGEPAIYFAVILAFVFVLVVYI